MNHSQVKCNETRYACSVIRAFDLRNSKYLDGPSKIRFSMISWRQVWHILESCAFSRILPYHLLNNTMCDPGLFSWLRAQPWNSWSILLSTKALILILPPPPSCIKEKSFWRTHQGRETSGLLTSSKCVIWRGVADSGNCSLSWNPYSTTQYLALDRIINLLMPHFLHL